MKKKEIFIIVSQKIDERNFQRFGYEVFFKNKWKVKTIYLNLRNYSHRVKEYKKIKSKDIIIINNIFDIIKYSKKIKNCFIYNLSNDSILQLILNIFLFKNKNTQIVRYDTIPFFKMIDRSAFSYIYNNYQKLLKIFFSKIVKLLNDIFFYIYKTQVICCLAGQVSKNNCKKYFKNVVNTHTYDYDFFIKDKKRSKNLKKIIFLDQYEENHPDYLIKNIKTVIKENYFLSLNNFFSNLERFTKKQVIIAGHPRAYHDKTRGFLKRKIEFFKSYDLIKNSSLVIAHDTTSINFACLLKKPIIIVYTNEMKKNYYLMNSILSFSRALGIKPINIDKINEKNIYKLKYTRNKIGYYRFIKNYISISMNNIPNSIILEKYLKDFILKH